MTSGSDRSASAVDPTTSQKSTVTVFRTSRDEAGAAPSGAAHELQKRAPAGFSWPHCAHSITIRVYGVGDAADVSNAFSILNTCSGT